MGAHSYTTGCPYHTRLIAIIAIISVFLSSALAWVAIWLQQKYGFAIGGSSSLAIFGAIFWFFDKYLWKFPHLRRVLLVPDLNGTWTVEGTTTQMDGRDANICWQAEITISQSWSKMVVTLKTDHSTSKSIAASLYRSDGEGYRLIYHYDNQPKVGEAKLRRHFGVCNILFDDSLSGADGSYFTDHDRITSGRMMLKKRKGPQ